MTLSDPTLSRLLHVLSIDRELSNSDIARRFSIGDDKVGELRLLHNLPRVLVTTTDTRAKRTWRERTGRR